MSGTAANHRARIGDAGLAARLAKVVSGEVRFDPLSRAIYSTDASIYQIEPIGVVLPKSLDDVSAVVEIARSEGVPVLPRGAGTSQAGQTVGHAIVVDTSRYLDRVLEVDEESRTALVQPGIVLDRLNEELRDTGLFFPVDVATANRATLGGMAGNNSGGARSIRYGIMADNVLGIEALLADGRVASFGGSSGGAGAVDDVEGAIAAIYAREASELAARVPTVQRHVAGYNLHRLARPKSSLVDVLVGSEGTLAFFRTLRLRLHRRPSRTVLGVCHFPSLVAALDAVQHIVTLEPQAVELIDQSLLELARSNPAFADSVSQFAPPQVNTLLLVEFAGDDASALSGALDRLDQLMSDVGYPRATVRAEDAQDQAAIWGVRRASLSIAMSMKGDRKPVSFIEDCAVPLEHLAAFGEGVNEIFARHGTSGTWYAHASVGCLHVRPALSMKDAEDVATMRAIAGETHALVASLHGSHSGEHGDGLLRSEFIRSVLGDRLADAFGEVKTAFDPNGVMNPGKIVDPPPMDDRTSFRYKPDYATTSLPTVLDWSPQHGFAAAIEMCNNNGACRKMAGGAMCPSFRATRDELHTTRARANTLRWALSGQLGNSIMSEAVKDALDLCVGCKACRSECPTGVDMARMKAEVLHQRHRERGAARRERLLANLPRTAAWVRHVAGPANLAARIGRASGLVTSLIGLDSGTSLPAWRADWYRDEEAGRGHAGGDRADGRVVLFADTLNRYFEPENLRDAAAVLTRLGRTPVAASAGGRPLCCGRTYISGGFLDDAAEELTRTIGALAPLAEQGLTIVGLEPSCLLTLRDEAPTLVPGPATDIVAERAKLLDEYLVEEMDAGRLADVKPPHATSTAWIHGHCHQKALGSESTVGQTLEALAGVESQDISSSCCGMAGSFGYEKEHVGVSLAMAELDLLPAVRAAGADELIVANGFSCRAQIHRGSGRKAVHAVRILADRLPTGT